MVIRYDVIERLIFGDSQSILLMENGVASRLARSRGKMGAGTRWRWWVRPDGVGARWGQGWVHMGTEARWGGSGGGARWEWGQIGAGGSYLVPTPIWYPITLISYLVTHPPYLVLHPPIWYSIPYLEQHPPIWYPYINEAPKRNSSILDICLF